MTPEEKTALHEFIEAAKTENLNPVIPDIEKLKLVLSALRKINNFLDWQKATGNM